MQEDQPKFKDLKWGAEIGGIMEGKQNNRIFPCELGEYTMFHIKGGQGSNRIDDYILRKGKTYIIDPLPKQLFFDKLHELKFELQWEGEGDDRKMVLKKIKEGIVKRLTDIVLK